MKTNAIISIALSLIFRIDCYILDFKSIFTLFVFEWL